MIFGLNRPVQTVAGWIFVIVWLGSMASCSRERMVQAKKPSAVGGVPVTVARVTQRSVPVDVRAIGNVQAYSTVEIRAEVGGELGSVHFREGQEVRKGDLLFTIDPRLFEAALRQAEANLTRDQAQLQHAEAEARRYEELHRSGIIATQQYDDIRTNAEALRSSVAADEAAVETARLQLAYTTIRSPLDGRTGNLLVHQGNLIRARDLVLVVIHQIRPIYVAFALPAQQLAEVQRRMAGGDLRVQTTPGNGLPSLTGMLTFVDNAVDPATGTIQLKATFDNSNGALWPGQFTEAVLTLATQPHAVVAPAEAVQTGQQGAYVFVVRPDSTAELRLVEPGRTVGAYTVVERGLQPGEIVVTDGQLRLSPDARVEITNRTGQGPT